METPRFLQDLPEQFEPLRAFLEGNLRPYIKIHAEEIGRINEDSSNDPLALWQSKIGGNPYFPKGVDYPTDPTTGEAMALVAQFNCVDLPPIQGLDLPQQGMLQFYMGGFQFADPAMDNSRIRTLYFPEVSQNPDDLITDFSFINVRETIRGDYDDICTLTFSAEHDLFWDSRPCEEFREELPEDLHGLFESFSDWLYEYYRENDGDNLGCKLGGHPDLCGSLDVMVETITGRLLLQLNFSDDYLFWFIEDQNLTNRDFSQIEFYYESD